MRLALEPDRRTWRRPLGWKSCLRLTVAERLQLDGYRWLTWYGTLPMHYLRRRIDSQRLHAYGHSAVCVSAVVQYSDVIGLLAFSCYTVVHLSSVY